MTVALDTNILVRLLVADDQRQTARAKDLVESNAVLISSTVVLETEWVLRSVYNFRRDKIRQAFVCLFGLPQVTLAQPNLISRALDDYGAGLDLADALHLASSEGARCFATFDRKLVKAAMQIHGTIDVVEP